MPLDIRFKRAYEPPPEADKLLRMATDGQLTLVHGARDEPHNDAITPGDVLLDAGT